MLDSGNTLDCALSQASWPAPCEQQVKQVMAIKERSKAKALYHANISNDYQTALKMHLKDSSLAGLKPLMTQVLKTSDFLYLALNPVQQPETFKALMKQVQTLDAGQRQRLIVSLDLIPDMNAKDWKRYKQDFQALRIASIQKIGINNYRLPDGQRIQQNLYQSLSMNDSPLTYRDPYQQGWRRQ